MNEPTQADRHYAAHVVRFEMLISEADAAVIVRKLSDVDLSRLVDAGRKGNAAQCRQMLGLVDLTEGQTIGVNGDVRVVTASGGKVTLQISPKHNAGDGGG